MAQGDNKEDENLTIIPPDFSDLDLSFTSTSASTSSFAATTTTAASSARSSISLSLPSSSSSSSSTLKPLPHRRFDPRWSALRAAANLSPDGHLHLRHLKLLRPLGSGNLARVFHCRLRGFDDPSVDFALKVVDLHAAAVDEAGSGKLSNVRMEARVLAGLDHPFLPALYARLDASHYACFLIDYCPGGDLHSLLRRRRSPRLPVAAVRFYAAEVLLALEYLHALGFVYRDLKPENVLLRADGHVMLSDFDLCFHSDVAPALHRRRHLLPRRRPSSSSCFLRPAQEAEELELVAEPEAAFSLECVGTHEYLSPEVISGAGHGNGVDWWAFGVFIYELLYGRTPFKGGSKESTLKNILARELRFPPETSAGNHGGEKAAARDLISRLLVRDPRRRMGSVRGAAEIKRHPFFRGVRWALIRTMKPPVVVGAAGARVYGEGKRWWSKKWSSCEGKWLKRLGLVGTKKKTTGKA
ncbi:Protein kinase PINOID [Apostasia shenzhenica]|uniref:non-specific serine/threonine protein kinase n=1 Tax=Apostasia shenzhenica TaxID=1088818 RepID=A0A2H9ZTD7_9ASPA|nr:Protein kinase PINOID [Apostasia shenzhenica]